MSLSIQRTEPSEWRIADEMYPSLKRFAAVTAPFDLDPDDLLQEAFVRVLRRHSLSDLDDPGAYLRRTMINLASNHNHRMGVKRRIQSRMTPSREETLVAPAYPSDLGLLEQLPPMERAALYLAEVEGYRFAEVARMIGCSESAARKSASRGRRRLQLTLATEEPK